MHAADSYVVDANAMRANLVDILERGIATPFAKGDKRGVGRR